MPLCFSWCLRSRKPTASVPSKVVQLKEVSAIPTAQDYILDASSEAIKILKSAIAIAGSVPGAQPVLELSLVLIQTCQALTEIEEKVAELKDHIEKIMLIMVAGITGQENANIPQDLITDIVKLRKDLQAIKEDLDKIASQSRLLVVLFRTANKAKVDRCMELLKKSLIHWEVARGISQGVALHDLQQGIRRMQDELQNISKQIHFIRKQAHAANHASSRKMPPKPAHFYGRDDFVEDIVRILVNTSSDPPRICIHGPGGMGKTSVALAVVEHPDVLKVFGKDNRFWVPCISATSRESLLDILYFNLRISRDTGDPLEDIVTELQSSDSPRLILLDNFETPWDPIEGEREDVERILHQLSSVSQLRILVTMRTNMPPSDQIRWVEKSLGVVSPETSSSIYCAIHPRAKGKPKLDELLNELGHMPFAITLIARLGKDSSMMPAALLKEWRRQGPEMLPLDKHGEDSISRSIGLSMNSRTMSKNDQARTLLAALSLLPAGTTHGRLDWWIPSFENKTAAAISVLSNAALIVNTNLDDLEVLISVLPVVQSYMQQHDRIPLAVRESVREACYKLVLEHASSPGDPKFKDDLQILSSEEMNLQSILLQGTRDEDITTASLSVPHIEKHLDVLIAFSWYQHWTRPRMEVIEHTLKFARDAQLEQYIAESLFCQGSSLLRLDRYEDAHKSFLEARDYFRKLPNPIRASECSLELSEVYIYLHDKEGIKDALYSLLEESVGSHPYLNARDNMARGTAAWYFLQTEEALEYLTAAKVAFETREINRPVDAANCLNLIARLLASTGRFPEAMEAVDESLNIYVKTGPQYSLVETLIVRGCILLSMEAPFGEVFPFLEYTLQKGQELGRELLIAQTLEVMGELHGRERKVASALEYYRAARDEYVKIVPDPEHVERCLDNCSQLELMEKDPGMEWNGKLVSRRLL